MAGLMNYIAAGAAAGIGEGLVQDGIAKRAEALKMLELQFRGNEAEKDRSLRINEGEKDRAARDGEATRQRGFQASQADEQRRFQQEEAERARAHQREEAERARAHTRGLMGNLKDFTDKDGKVWFVGPDGAAKPVMDAAGNQVVRRPERGDAEDLVEVGDPNSPTGTIYVPKSQAAGKPGKTGAKEAQETAAAERDQQRRVARQQAESEARQKAGWISTDATDFADTGGSREAWIERRTDEIMAGKAKATEKPQGASKPGAEKQVAAKMPPGTGSRGDPYRPTSKAEFEAMASGALYVNPADGKLYRKN